MSSFFLEHIDEFKIGLSDYQILPDEDLIQLVQSDSDQKAIITLFAKYIRLIISISVKYLEKQSKEDLDGFIGIGIQGFLKAINDFGTKIYATYDSGIQNDVSRLLNQLQTRFGYTEDGAKNLASYVIRKELPQKFKKT